MTNSEILIISLLGVTIVFIGLLLTTLLVYLFSFLNWYSEKGKQSALHQQLSKETIPVSHQQDISPEIVSIITLILEIEFKIKDNLIESRFTFNDE